MPLPVRAGGLSESSFPLKVRPRVVTGFRNFNPIPHFGGRKCGGTPTSQLCGDKQKKKKLTIRGSCDEGAPDENGAPPQRGGGRGGKELGG